MGNGKIFTMKWLHFMYCSTSYSYMLTLAVLRPSVHTHTQLNPFYYPFNHSNEERNQALS